jgi:hypothetical protein
MTGDTWRKSLPCKAVDGSHAPQHTHEYMLIARLIIWFSIFTVHLNFTIPEKFQFIARVEVEGEQHFSDPMGNVYVIKDNTLKKISPAHKQVAEYTNAFLGKIYSVDISDPLRILLFFKDNKQVLWVDNFLSEIRSPVWLDDLGADQAELVCSSSQGGFWVYSSLNNQLQYFDVNLSLVHVGTTLNSLMGPDIRPNYLIEKNRSVYLNVPGTGILVFDRFGNYSKTLPVDAPGAFQVTDRYIYFSRNGKLYSCDLKTLEILSLALPGTKDTEGDEMIPDGSHQAVTEGPPGEFRKAELQPGFLYIYTSQSYWIYKTNP